MLYLLFEWIEQTVAPPGFQVFQFSTVRAGLAAGTALLVALFAGKKIIRALRRRQLGETVREGADAGVVSHAHKAGTPTMGGVILLLALASGTLLWADLRNAYVWVALVATLWMGAFGFADDYIKVVKKDKEGIAPKVKLAGQLS
ncbi:MAG: phospho-N-acetylmuramoyl-pentapeptide-transferase, partial [Bacteroidota bacterium]